jgi:cell wall-associated NlpC family hydrolase
MDRKWMTIIAASSVLVLSVILSAISVTRHFDAVNNEAYLMRIQEVEDNYQRWLKDYDTYLGHLNRVESEIELAQELLASNPDVENSEVIQNLRDEIKEYEAVDKELENFWTPNTAGDPSVHISLMENIKIADQIESVKQSVQQKIDRLEAERRAKEEEEQRAREAVIAEAMAVNRSQGGGAASSGWKSTAGNKVAGQAQAQSGTSNAGNSANTNNDAGNSANTTNSDSGYNPYGHPLSAAAMKYNGLTNASCDALLYQALMDIGYPPMSGNYIVTRNCDNGKDEIGGKIVLWENFTHNVSPSDIQPGDIIKKPGHVAIWLGGGKAIHGGWYCSNVQVAATSLDGYSVYRLN